MIIYRCVISGDEMFTDVYKITEPESGLFYVVEGKLTTRKNDDVSKISIGANPSADETVEAYEASSVSGVDIALNNDLKETTYTKKQYKLHIKDYVKSIRDWLKKNNPDRVEDFEKEAAAEIPKLLTDFDNYRFFTGSSMNEQGMVGLLDFSKEGKPIMLFFKDGLEKVKFVSIQ
ncbi:translationally-controlled tumor protein homolog [Plectropomus leopardus]|uniref:translationally-controlled tumor protein homolog n=1 Tax=Plectropomus leopardus TaxID=160734 RepID=UPI001C4D681A|nr:translationally-controlled tumor protein homolog [Plectropomus leopardus]